MYKKQFLRLHGPSLAESFTWPDCRCSHFRGVQPRRVLNVVQFVRRATVASRRIPSNIMASDQPPPYFRKQPEPDPSGFEALAISSSFRRAASSASQIPGNRKKIVVGLDYGTTNSGKSNENEHEKYLSYATVQDSASLSPGPVTWETSKSSANGLPAL